MRACQFVFGVSIIQCNRNWVSWVIAACMLVVLGVAPVTAVAADSDRIVAAGLIDILDKKSARRIAVIGDSLAQDLWNGLHRLYRSNEKIEFIKFTQVSTGLVRDDVYDWSTALKSFVDEHQLDIAIVLMGGNDRQPIRANGRRLKRHTDAWAKEYGRRVAGLIKILKPETKAVYWLSLPIVRSGRMARDYRRFNKIYRAQAEAQEVKFINTWTLFDDENGAYTSFGADVKGVNRRLRKDDGMHFTVAGKLRFAYEIIRIIGRDLSPSKSENRVEPSGG